MMELAYRVLATKLGQGLTSISEVAVLPSRVTNLVIQRPFNFKFGPGDWVFIKIPEIAASEWHPFTISSAPEMEDHFTLHIRAVGQWTNRLYDYFEREYNLQGKGREKEKSGTNKFRRYKIKLVM